MGAILGCGPRPSFPFVCSQSLNRRNRDSEMEPFFVPIFNSLVQVKILGTNSGKHPILTRGPIAFPLARSCDRTSTEQAPTPDNGRLRAKKALFKFQAEVSNHLHDSDPCTGCSSVLESRRWS
eukprot:3433730-Rhodomonas_salina.1